MINDDSMVENPVLEKPVDDVSLVEISVVENPVVEQSTVGQSAVAQSAVAQSAVAAPVVELSVVGKTAPTENDRWTISAPTPWDTSSFAGLRAVLREDQKAIATSRLAPGYLALAVHRFGEWINADTFPRLLRVPAAVIHKFLLGYVRSYLGFEIDKSVRLGRRVRFHHQHGVVIDSAVVIGDDCVLHHNVTLAARPRVDSPKNPYHAPQIGSGVNLGTGCVILGGVRIGDGAVIGPNAIVTMDVPPGASVVSQSARILRMR